MNTLSKEQKRALKFQFDLALMFYRSCWERSEGFTRPLDSYTDEELMLSIGIGCYRTLAYMVHNNILHPRHHAEIKKALPYLTALKELQDEAWQRAQQKRNG